MLGYCAIVTEGPKELELNGPLSRNDEIALLATTRIALGRCATIVRRSRALFEVLKRSVYGVCLCEGADARSISPRPRGSLRARFVHCLESICEVADYV